jgi:hypothetical protein
MKIISLPTIYTPPIGNQQDGNITLFFEFSEEQYNRLVNTDFDDIWQVLDALLAWSDDHWNLDAYMENNRLKPHHSAYEHTTQTDISFFPI